MKKNTVRTIYQRPPDSNAFMLCVLLLAALSGIAGTARAQKDIIFDHLTVKQGLSQGTVVCIFQDSRGFMWFGTQDGLNRYDGYECTVYKNDPGDASTISDNFVVSIAEDSSHILWFGTVGTPDILNRFNRLQETFTRVSRDSVNLAGARISASRSIYTDRSGVQWSGSGNTGLTRLDLRTGRTTVFKHDPKNPASLLSDKVYSVAGDRSGMIWIGTREGLEKLDPKTGIFTHYRHDEKSQASISDNYVWPVLIDRNGILWAGTFSGGLDRFDSASGSFTHYRHDDARARSLAGDRIYALYQDASGMIWAGTGDHGVDRFHPELVNFEHYFHDPASPAGLVDNNISCLYVDHAGLVWIGTENGIDCLDRSRGTFTLYKHDPNNPRSVGDNSAQVMMEDHAGNLWIGMVSGGLDRFTRSTREFVHFKNNPADPKSLADNRVYALAEDRDGGIWVGTYGGGLCRLEPGTREFHTFAHNDSIPTTLGAPGVWSLLEDSYGTLWAGTYGGGLDRFNPGAGTFTHFAHSDSNVKSISDNIVVCLLEDRNGALWAGTTGGLDRFDRQTGTFQTYTEKSGLPNNMIFGMLEDNRGNIWLSTNKGVAMLDSAHSGFSVYDYSSGLQGDEFNQGAYAKDPQTGELLFGGPNGFNIFQPGSMKRNTYVPPIVFTSFVRYNTDDQAGKPIREPGIDLKSSITLSYKDNVANFEFAALNFHNSVENRYAYQLEGYNTSWIQLGRERRATFTNLDGGTYVLHVKGSNDEGVWNETGAALTIVVNPPWWKTRWAYGGYGTLFILLLYGARAIELNRREEKARLRESELHAKAAEAEKRALQAENDRKTKELEDARVLQLSMLPKDVPHLSGFEIAVSMKTATEVGGDYYDFNISPDGALNVAFGDATGHGMQAGTIVTLMKGLFISDVSKSDLQVFCNQCSQSIKEIRLGRLYMALTLLRLREERLQLTSGGMPPAYLYRKKSKTIEEILLKAVPIGSMKSFPYPLYETNLETGDTLLFLTDGLPEQKNASQEMFDYRRVTECFKSIAELPPEEIIARLVSAGEAWMDGVAQDDDITLMVIRKTAIGAA